MQYSLLRCRVRRPLRCPMPSTTRIRRPHLNSWLTISNSSATGTGTGSFQYSAADNTTQNDRTAIIAVASQTLTVVQGTTSGSPGVGSVTVNGSPQSTQINECPGNPYGPCMETLWEGGAVTVWVNGQSYSVQYTGSTNSSASLAASLVALMNTPSSLISAQQTPPNGSTITITSTVDGSATDYPLSTSFGFNTSNFSTPAFQAMASGPSLTGGAN